MKRFLLSFLSAVLFSGSVFASGANPPPASDANLRTSDITTNDVSTAKHGFAPKAPNDAAQYLDGTGAWSAPQGGLILLDHKTASTSASIDFTGVMSSSYDNYVLIFKNVVPATANAKLYIEYSSTDGSSWITSASYFSPNLKFSGSGVVTGVAGITTAFQLGDSASNSALVPITGVFEAYDLNNATDRKGATWRGSFNDASGSFAAANNFGFVGGGIFSQAVAVNAIRVIMSAGNISKGDFYLYAVKQQ